MKHEVEVYILDDLYIGEKLGPAYSPKPILRGDDTFMFALVLLDGLRTLDSYQAALKRLRSASGRCLFVLDMSYVDLMDNPNTQGLIDEVLELGIFKPWNDGPALLGFRALFPIRDNPNWTGLVAIATNTAELPSPRADSIVGKAQSVLQLEGNERRLKAVTALGTSSTLARLEAILRIYADTYAPHPNSGDAEFYLNVPDPPGGTTWFQPGRSHDSPGSEMLLAHISQRFDGWSEDVSKAVFNCGHPTPFRKKDVEDKQHLFAGKVAGGRREFTPGALQTMFPKLDLVSEMMGCRLCLPCQPGMPFLLAVRELLYHLRDDHNVLLERLDTTQTASMLIEPVRPDLKGGMARINEAHYIALSVRIEEVSSYRKVKRTLRSTPHRTGGVPGLAELALGCSWIGEGVNSEPTKARSFLERTLTERLQRTYIWFYSNDTNQHVGVAWPLGGEDFWEAVDDQ